MRPRQGNVRRMGDAGIREWWEAIPPLTRCLFGASFALTLLGNFGFLPIRSLLFSSSAIVRQLQVWRLLTPFFTYGLGFPFLIDMLFLYTYSQKLENDHFIARKADYLFFLLFGAAFLLIGAVFLRWGVMGKGLILHIVYYWSKKVPNAEMQFMFGIPFKSAYFPWVLVAMALLTGADPVILLGGIFVSHLYLYLDEIIPATQGVTIIRTPEFLFSLFPPEQNRGAMRGVAPPGRRAEDAPGRPQQHQWGAGQRLE